MGCRTKKPFSFLAKYKKNKTSRSTLRKSGSIGFECLEQREVMAANITAAWAGSVLTIEGTPGADTITVSQDGASVSVQGSTAGGGQMGLFFSRAQISSIKINGLSGADTIKMVESNANAEAKPIPMTVYGGLGDDVITGGSGLDKLYGGGPQDDWATSFDSNGLYVAPEGEYFNSGGKQEKWMKSSVTGSWHFMTPDGSLYRQTQPGYAIGTLLYKFDPQYYQDLSMLTEASTGLSAANLDRSLNLTFAGIQNYYGYNEKWFNSNSGMINITPDGVLRRSSNLYSGIGTPIASFDPSYWANPSKLANASSALGDVDTIDGKSGADYIYGGREGDTLIGGYGNDVIHGDAGNDVIWGGEKNNSLQYLSNDADEIWGDLGDDVAYGGGDVDNIWGLSGVDALYGDNDNDYLYGGDQGDALYGGKGNDQIWGESGVDKLYGGANDDKLYGGADYDYLFGQEGADFCDAGAAGEYVDGGTNTDGKPERDVDPYVIAKYGASYNADIRQGGPDTCWILASIAAVSRTEDLLKRIRYVGDNTFEVAVYTRKDNNDAEFGGFNYGIQRVYFDGTSAGADPVFIEDHVWVIIMQRAVIQAIGKFDSKQTIDSVHTGGALDPLSILTGKWGSRVPPASVGSAAGLYNLVEQGKRVTVLTNNTGISTLLPKHYYTVVGYSGNNVILYNPWGTTESISWTAFVKDASVIDYV